MPVKVNLSREIEEKVIFDYFKGETFKELKNRYKIQRNKVLNILKLYNLKERSKIEFPNNRNRNKTRRYKYDQTFFNHIDTQEKAYFLGFILADGHVSDSGLEISISEIDSHILYEFIKCIGGNNKIKHGKKFNKIQNVYWEYCRLHLTSIDIRDALNKLGLYKNKTYNISIPHISIELQSHFWRGVFDGDGWVSKYQWDSKKLIKTTNTIKVYKRTSFEFGVCGHYNTICALNNFLIQNHIKAGIGKHSSIFRLRISNKDRIKFIKLLYNNASEGLYLIRKYKTCSDFLKNEDHQ